MLVHSTVCRVQGHSKCLLMQIVTVYGSNCLITKIFNIHIPYSRIRSDSGATRIAVGVFKGNVNSTCQKTGM